MKIKTNSPLEIFVEAGVKYSWCSCGFSKNMPLCDNAHREFSDKKSVKFIADSTKSVFLCGCSETKTPPYCDGNNNCRS